MSEWKEERKEKVVHLENLGENKQGSQEIRETMMTMHMDLNMRNGSKDNTCDHGGGRGPIIFFFPLFTTFIARDANARLGEYRKVTLMRSFSGF